MVAYASWVLGELSEKNDIPELFLYENLGDRVRSGAEPRRCQGTCADLAASLIATARL